MKHIILDGKIIKEKKHDYLKEILEFPDYYGRNLDALYDCLTEIGVETEIELINSEYVNQDLIDTFFDASLENTFLYFICDEWYAMKLIEINGKIIRKDPKYYLQDVLELQDYDGSYEKLEEFLENLEEETEIHIINTGCMTNTLLDLFISISSKSDKLTVYVED